MYDRYVCCCGGTATVLGSANVIQREDLWMKMAHSECGRLRAELDLKTAIKPQGKRVDLKAPLLVIMIV